MLDTFSPPDLFNFTKDSSHAKKTTSTHKHSFSYFKKMTHSIETIQNAIIQEFSSLGKNRELLLDYLMDLGANMVPLAEKDKTPQHLVPGCLAQVWLVQKEKKNRLWLRADSNASITKGLASLLVRTFSGQPINDIINTEPFFLSSTGLDELIGPQRSSGFEHMLQTIKHYAYIHMSPLTKKI